MTVISSPRAQILIQENIVVFVMPGIAEMERPAKVCNVLSKGE
jgi:hypothetical protein